ncbi:hypothetical protein R69927_05054 [Paraburkholderia domus]|nr:hypothetical protein R69927_05054 [Paraburkholderia domus]
MMRVPDDFPRDAAPAALAGAQPKLAARMINGRFVVGLTEEERMERGGSDNLDSSLSGKAGA